MLMTKIRFTHYLNCFPFVSRDSVSKIKKEAEIHYANLSDTYKHIFSILTPENLGEVSVFRVQRLISGLESDRGMEMEIYIHVAHGNSIYEYCHAYRF